MPKSERSEVSDRRGVPYIGLLVLAAIALLIIAILLPHPGKAPDGQFAGTNSAPGLTGMNTGTRSGRQGVPAPATFAAPANAQEIVSAKLAQFARGRQQIVAAMAGKFQVEVAPMSLGSLRLWKRGDGTRRRTCLQS